MTFAFSTSSPIVSVAIFCPEGELLYSGERESKQAASNACLELLSESGLDVRKGTRFLADLGPGSFTGTRVGVTLAKTLAWTAQGLCGGASAFDLISTEQTVVFPSKRGEWFIRRPDMGVVRGKLLPEGPYIGFGPSIDSPVYPHATRFRLLMQNLLLGPPEALVPLYLIDPSISKPKQPLNRLEGLA